ncbi:MAG: indolepyruvate oxidoreductase subunit beta [Oscillospiraceae bacterium]|nr:indolepyruvate oxidoreductase subunit beta [Oscillospiraceae bacterium]MCL2278923.1 indolepyruvate oxidoreductase subunit beta [Oscillospiraceae bacterium]
METRNIVIVGVGGQGSLLACNLMGRALMIEGYDAKVSEVHGMSQRGGSVVTYVRYGDKVYSPIVDDGQAELLVSFELLEAARWFNVLAPGGTVVTNTQQINPIPVILGAAKYPENLLGKFEDNGAKVDAIDALALAEKAGSSKTVNIVMMGRLSKYFPFSEETWHKALEQTVPPKFLEMNKKAFKLGASA